MLTKKFWDCLGCHLLLPEPGGGLKWGTGGWEIVGYRTRTPGQVYSTKYNLLFKANSFRSPKLEGCAMRICQLLKFEQNRRTIASLIKIKNCNFGSNFTKIAHKESKKMFNKLSQHILDGKLKVDNTLFIGLFLSFITCEDTHYFLAVLKVVAFTQYTNCTNQLKQSKFGARNSRTLNEKCFNK